MTKTNGNSLTRFALNTALLPTLIAETILEQSDTNLTKSQRAWFVEHVEQRMRATYEKNEHFANVLDKARTPLVGFEFIEHWLKAYKSNPLKYMQKYITI
jgi:hypothetical protein